MGDDTQTVPPDTFNMYEHTEGVTVHVVNDFNILSMVLLNGGLQSVRKLYRCKPTCA